MSTMWGAGVCLVAPGRVPPRLGDIVVRGILRASLTRIGAGIPDMFVLGVGTRERRRR